MQVFKNFKIANDECVNEVKFICVVLRSGLEGKLPGVRHRVVGEREHVGAALQTLLGPERQRHFPGKRRVEGRHVLVGKHGLQVRDQRLR